MAASLNDIKGWLAQGKARGATHMIVMCDTFDMQDYPIYVMPGEKPLERVAEVQEEQDEDNPMGDRLMEIYNYSMDLDEQLRERRAYHP